MPLFNHIPNERLSSLPNLRSIDYEGSRFYLSPSGHYMPSVTTVVNDSKKEFFAKWKSDPKNEAHAARAADRGTMLHSTIERYLQNDPEFMGSISLTFQPMMRQIVPVLDRISDIHCQETAMWSDKLCVAGRVDCIAVFDGHLSIIDFKGSDKPKEEHWINSYFQQETLYSLMALELAGLKINQIVTIIAVENDIEPQVFIKNPWDYAKAVFKTIRDYRRNNAELLEAVEIVSSKQRNKNHHAICTQ